MTIAELNAMDAAAFVRTVGWVCEDSPWVAGRASVRRPFAGIDELHAALVGEIGAAARDEQLALLRAHPDLGARIRMSTASVGEQAGAGLDRLSDAEHARLQQLNTAYREKFGFPFLYAVKGSTPRQILASLEARLDRDADDEFAEAVRQVARIVRFRLDDVFRA